MIKLAGEVQSTRVISQVHQGNTHSLDIGKRYSKYVNHRSFFMNNVIIRSILRTVDQNKTSHVSAVSIFPKF